MGEWKTREKPEFRSGPLLLLLLLLLGVMVRMVVVVMVLRLWLAGLLLH